MLVSRLKIRRLHTSSFVSVSIAGPFTALLTSFHIVWESLEAHQKLIGDPIYPTLISQLAPAVAGALKLQHVEFTGDVAIAFGAPVTEVAVSKLREGKSKEDVDTFMPVMVDASKVPPVAHGPCAYGEVIEEPGTFYLVLGWDSPEVRCSSSVALKDIAVRAGIQTLISMNRLIGLLLASKDLGRRS
jgi:hypothetical protein